PPRAGPRRRAARRGASRRAPPRRCPRPGRGGCEECRAAELSSGSHATVTAARRAWMRVKHPVRSAFDVFVRRAPIEAQLIVTRRCNLTCGYCTEYDEVSEMIPLDTLKERIDALHRLHVINITLLGGEPLMHPQIAEIVAYGDRKAQVSITTNGFLLSEELIHKLNDANLLNMEVSVDALQPDRSLFIQKSLKSVRPKLELLRKHAKFDVRINIVLCDRTKDGFKETIREMRELGFVVSIDLLHDDKGAIAIGGEEYSRLWEHQYAEGRPFSFIERDYAARLLAGERPK